MFWAVVIFSVSDGQHVEKTRSLKFGSFSMEISMFKLTSYIICFVHQT